MNNEQYQKFNQILMVMCHSPRSQKWFLTHSYSQKILDEMVSLGYLVLYENDNEMYYSPTEKSKEIW